MLAPAELKDIHPLGTARDYILTLTKFFLTYETVQANLPF